MIETHKRQARYCYSKYKAYQPLTNCWHEADLVVHSEFRDGNVPAMRSDSAGYQKELLKYCAGLVDVMPSR